jgi:hypothetical protein
VVGGRVIATGGPVTVTLQPTGVGFLSDIWLFGPGTPLKIGLFVHNLFGPDQVDTIKETELCVPSTESSG